MSYSKGMCFLHLSCRLLILSSAMFPYIYPLWRGEKALKQSQEISMNSRLSLISVVGFLFMNDILPSDKTKSLKKLNVLRNKYIDGMAHAIKAI